MEKYKKVKYLYKYLCNDLLFEILWMMFGNEI